MKKMNEKSAWMGGGFRVCDHLYENLAVCFVLFFLSFFLSVAGAGQLLNLVFSKLIASGVGLEAETCLITHSPISWH